MLDARGFPLLVLEAKAEDKIPLVGKEQARKYAKSQNCRFVMLSNGNLHHFWDLERGNPYVITSFPTPNSVTGYQKVTPNPQRLIEDPVGEDYIVRTQRPNYQSEAGWRSEAERPGYIQTNKLRFLRPYQLKAIHSLQAAVGEGNDRFLFEMATGTGKTLTAAAVIKLFLRSGNASRVLFLVDRLELEDQAWKAFVALLSADCKAVIYKESRDDWQRAEIVVTTVQSLLFNNKYQKLFSPTDFDLVISDEAHRSIGGNRRTIPASCSPRRDSRSQTQRSLYSDQGHSFQHEDRGGAVSLNRYRQGLAHFLRLPNGRGDSLRPVDLIHRTGPYAAPASSGGAPVEKPVVP